MSQIVFTPNAPSHNPLLSQALTHDDLIFTSGQTPTDPATDKMPEGIEAQAEQCIKNLKAVLEAGGSDLQHVIKATCYLGKAEDFVQFNAVYGKHFTGKPARSCFAVIFPNTNMLCEIEAVAETFQGKG